MFVCGRAFAPLLAATSVLLAGCNDASRQQAQQRVLDYQIQIGRINQAFTKPPIQPRAVEALLSRGIRRYERLKPPPQLRGLNARIVTDLRIELISVQHALHAASAGDSAALSRAEAKRVRAQEDLNRALRRINSLVSVCTADPSRC